MPLACLDSASLGIGVWELFDPPRFRSSRNPSISADGRCVAFESWTHTNSPMGTPTGPSDIFVHDRQTGQTTRVSVATSTPIATGTGGWIASISDRDGNEEIYKMRADGSQITRLTDDPALDWWPSWGP